MKRILLFLTCCTALLACKKDETSSPTYNNLPITLVAPTDTGSLVANFDGDTLVWHTVELGGGYGANGGNDDNWHTYYTASVYDVPPNNRIVVTLGKNVFPYNGVSDDVFFNYLKTGPGQYTFGQSAFTPATSTHFVSVRVQMGSQAWVTDSVAQPANAYFEIGADTVHTRYDEWGNNNPAVLFNAKFRCRLKNVTNGTIKDIDCSSFAGLFYGQAE